MTTFTKIAAELACKTAEIEINTDGTATLSDGTVIRLDGEKAGFPKLKGANLFDRAKVKVKPYVKDGLDKLKSGSSAVLSAAKKHPIIAGLTALGVPGLAAGGYYLTHRDKGDDE